MSSMSSTSTLPSWDPMELFTLVNPNKLSVTCVGYALSKRRRCHNAIAYRNIQAAKEVMRLLVRPDVEVDELKEMLFNLAEYTLCRGANHQSQAAEVSDRWFELVRRERGEDEDWGSDTSEDDDDDDDESDDGGSSIGNTSDDEDDDTDDDDNGTPRRTTNSTHELRRRFDGLEALQTSSSIHNDRVSETAFQQRLSRPNNHDQTCNTPTMIISTTPSANTARSVRPPTPLGKLTRTRPIRLPN